MSREVSIVRGVVPLSESWRPLHLKTTGMKDQNQHLGRRDTKFCVRKMLHYYHMTGVGKAS